MTAKATNPDHVAESGQESCARADPTTSPQSLVAHCRMRNQGQVEGRFGPRPSLIGRSLCVY